MSVFSLALFAAFFTVAWGDEKYIISTKQGKVEGNLASNGLYCEFLGIRYGVPVKFKAPLAAPSFSDVYKADSRAVLCPQFPSNDPLAAPSDSEDCLVLNVFTPSPVTGLNTTLPVMVFLHGGGFGVGAGSPSFYGPQYLVSHGVVVVTLNYRLNAYGFLNLGIEGAPGNAGLKDIREALRWVKENILNFGGDVDNVTVFGQGSGGTAAIYLTLSESTKGLFHRVISESGTLFTPESFDHDALATASQVAKSLELISTDPEKLLKVYTDTPIMKVEEAIAKQMHPQSVFRPSVETTFDDEEPFLTDTPFNILTAGKKHKSFNPVPIIIGLNTVEGLIRTLDYNTITSQMDRIKHEDYSALDQRSLIVPKDEVEEFRNIMKETYFTNVTSDEALIGGLINCNSDFSYTGPMSLFSELYSNSSSLPVYEFIFNYIGNRNLGRLLTNSSLPATANRDELFYIFELERLPLPMDENDARIVTFMTMMWTNFAKFGYGGGGFKAAFPPEMSEDALRGMCLLRTNPRAALCEDKQMNTPTPDPASGEWLPAPHHLEINLEPQYVAPLTPDRAYFWRAFFYKYGTGKSE